MSCAKQMLDTYPREFNLDAGKLAAATEATPRQPLGARREPSAPSAAHTPQSHPGLTSAAPAKTGMEKAVSKSKRVRSKAERETPLRQLIDSGFLQAPIPLQGRYAGQTFTAVVNADGATVFEGKTYNKPSGAGRAAKASIRGADAPASVLATDGWAFWSAQDEQEAWTPLEELRRRYVEDQAAVPPA